MPVTPYRSAVIGACLLAGCQASGRGDDSALVQPGPSVRLASNLYEERTLLEEGDTVYVQYTSYFLISGLVEGGTEQVVVYPDVYLKGDIGGIGGRIAGGVAPTFVELIDWNPDDRSGWFDVRAYIGSHPDFDEEDEWCEYVNEPLDVVLNVKVELDDQRLVSETLWAAARTLVDEGDCGFHSYTY